MEKRGQVTIFVIIALVVVSGILIGVYFLNKQKQTESPGVKDVSGYVSSCLEEVSREAVNYVGRQGGYYNAPNGSNNFLFYPAPYYFNETQNLVPGEQVIAREIGLYIESNLDFCLGNFSDFTQRGFAITKQSNKASAKIGNDEVLVSAKVPVSITIGNSTSLLSDFSASVRPVRFESLLEASRDIAESGTKDPRTMCLSCVQNIAKSNGLAVDIIETDSKNDFIFTLSDSRSNFTGSPYEYSFAARYKFPECNTLGGCRDALS